MAQSIHGHNPSSAGRSGRHPDAGVGRRLQHRGPSPGLGDIQSDHVEAPVATQETAPVATQLGAERKAARTAAAIAVAGRAEADRLRTSPWCPMSTPPLANWCRSSPPESHCPGVCSTCSPATRPSPGCSTTPPVLLWRGTTKRTATAAQIKALIARDGGCVGCHCHPVLCQAHHIKPASQGGPTTIATWRCCVGTATTRSTTTNGQLAATGGLEPPVRSGVRPVPRTAPGRRAGPVTRRRCVGCHCHPALCQAHHIKPASQGGPTTIANMALLC